MMLALYTLFSNLAAPFLPYLLKERLREGKEIESRISERFGHASVARPSGKLIWFHAASVGEFHSIYPLMQELLLRDKGLSILLTTMTVTSARRYESQRLGRVIHQFVPLDVPAYAARFMAHWKPDAAFLVESEIWPNLVKEMKKSVPLCGIINGRMSERSFRKWRFFSAASAALLNGLTVFAQSETDAGRYREIGAKDVHFEGNLKFDAPALPCDERELERLKAMVKGRKVWLAASTHPEEEPEITEYLHPRLKAEFPDILTIIAPRHPERGEPIHAAAKHSALRSAGDTITDGTEIYIADTMGELGLFYRLSNIVFMGGSLFPHGGQNIIEPARIGCTTLWGPHAFNFEDAAKLLALHRAGLQVNDVEDLLRQLTSLLRIPLYVQEIGENAATCMQAQSGIVVKMADAIMSAMQRKSAAI